VFDPGAVLETLYKEVCVEIGKTALLTHDGSTDWLLPKAFVTMIEAQMRQHFMDALESGVANFASATHEKVVRSFQTFWHRYRSRETCLVCLRRKPHVGLPCGHTLCENCISVFGRSSSRDPWTFDIDSCFLCRVDTLGVKARIHPPTAGASVLSIDGGGVRGQLPLAFLEMLEDRIGLPMPVLEHFRVVFGTSSGMLIRVVYATAADRCDEGGIITLGLSQGWSIQKCIEMFPRLAKAAFQHRSIPGFPFVPKAVQSLVSLLADSLYPAANIESALKEAFGEENSMLDMHYATSLGIRVGIPVATLREPALCLFTNYNGIGSRTHDPGRLLLAVDL
jgi:hypothetical protein